MGAISSFRISGFGFLSPFAIRHSSFGFLSEPFAAGRATVQRRAGFQPARRARQRERFRSVGVADGGRQDACPTLLFKESLHSLVRMHWDHEPRRGGRRRASVLDCGSPLPLLRPRTRAESARGLAHSKTWRYGGRFMERYDDLSFFLSPSLAGLCLDFAHDAEPNRFHHRHGHWGGQDDTGHGAHLLFAQSWPEGGGAQTNLLRRAGRRARSAEVARWRNDASGNQSMEFSRPARAPPRRAA